MEIAARTTFVLLLLLSSPTLAWGPIGHRDDLQRQLLKGGLRLTRVLNSIFGKKK